MKGIYIIKNLINGKVYIGQSINIYQRWKTHKSAYKRIKNKLYSAIKSYGLENFSFEILEGLPEWTTPEQLSDKEKEYICKYKSYKPEKGYNLTYGGEVHKLTPEAIENMKGASVSPETRKKISDSLKGRFKGENSPNWGRKVSEETKAKIYTEERNRKISESHKGVPMSKSHLEAYKKSHWSNSLEKKEMVSRKISDAQKGRIQSKESNEKRLLNSPSRKNVFCNETGEIFLSKNQAVKKYGRCVRHYLEGNTKSTRIGLTFKYIENDSIEDGVPLAS